MPARTSSTIAGHGAANDAVAEFLDLAGHELRGPITSLKGQAQLFRRRLARQNDREPDVAELNKMLYQVERLEHELDVYLEAARIQRKRARTVPELFDLADLVRKLVDLYAHSAASAAVRLETDTTTLFGVWDKRRLRLALSVLLANAVKYGGEAEVVVRLHQVGDTVRIEVLDHGIGIPSKERGAIFKAYATGSNAENSGVGLGLFVARELTRKHHGRIGVRPRDGGGSMFWMELPLTPPEPTGHGTAHATHDLVREPALSRSRLGPTY